MTTALNAKPGSRKRWNREDIRYLVAAGSPARSVSIRELDRSIVSNMPAAPAANAARMTKNQAWCTLLHKVPTAPAVRLPENVARNHAATVVAANPEDGRRANRPRPVGRMCSPHHV